MTALSAPGGLIDGRQFFDWTRNSLLASPMFSGANSVVRNAMAIGMLAEAAPLLKQGPVAIVGQTGESLKASRLDEILAQAYEWRLGDSPVDVAMPAFRAANQPRPLVRPAGATQAPLLAAWRRTWTAYKPRHIETVAKSDPIVKDPALFMSDLFGLGKIWWLPRNYYGTKLSLLMAISQSRGILRRHFLDQASAAAAPFEDFVQRLIEWRGEKGFPNRSRRMIRDALREASLLRPEEVPSYFSSLLPASEVDRIRNFRENKQEAILRSFIVGVNSLIIAEAKASGSKPYNVVAVGLTGSYVYGTATPESDIDVAVVTRDGTVADVEEFIAKLEFLGVEKGWPSSKDWARYKNVFPMSAEAVDFAYRGLPHQIVSPYPEVVRLLGGEKVMTEFWKPGRFVRLVHPVFDFIKRKAMRLLISRWERGTPEAPAAIAESATAIQPLEYYSEWLASLQRGLDDRYGVKKVFIGGGSSVAVLDHLLHGKPLDMRDFDIFVDADRRVDAALIADMGQKLNDPALGTFSEKDIRPRPRANSAFPAPERYTYNAGYGSFWKKSGRTLDLSVFHSAADIGLNGALTTERIRIPLEADTDLRSWVKRHAGKPYDQLVVQRAVIDPDGGYSDWQDQRTRIVNWDKIRSDPATEAIRLARAYARLGHAKFPETDASRIRLLLSYRDPSNPRQAARSLLKAVSDMRSAPAFHMLAQVDALSLFSPALNRLVARLPPDELSHLLDGDSSSNGSRAPPQALGRLERLFDRLPAPQRVPLYAMLYEAEPRWAGVRLLRLLNALLAEHVGPGLKPLEQAASMSTLLSDKSVKVGFGLEVSRIAGSQVLTPKQKRDLMIRAMLRRFPSENRQAILRALWPGLTSSKQERYLALAGRVRAGFLTGVFNPFHHGHLDLMRHSIEQMALDEMTVIPTPKTNHNETPIAWELRLNMAAQGIRGIPEASVISRDYERAFQKGGTGEAIRKLKTGRGGETDWVHVMGADSFERRTWLEYSGDEIFVVTRTGHHLDVPPAKRGWIHPFGAEVIEFREEARSSTLLRRSLRQGLPISEMVPAAVEDYIRSHGLYGEATGSKEVPPMKPVDFRTKDAVSIAGNYWQGSDRAVLLLHMMPATKESWRDFAAALNKTGLTVLAIDLRGHGGSVRRGDAPLDYKKFSDGEHQASIQDVEAAVDYLRSRGAKSVVLAGASIGANLV